MSEQTDPATATLRQTQEWLASVILQPEKLDDPSFRHEIERVVATEPCERAIDRLRAYTGGLPARISEALVQDHPALAHVIGPSAFHDLVHRYLPHVPAGIYNLNDVGSSLPEFISQDESQDESQDASHDELASAYPFAADLARLERAVRVAFHARDGAPLDPGTLAAWGLDDWSAAVLGFQPSVAMVLSSWPIRDIWAARHTPLEDIDIVLEGRSQHVLVHRSGYEVVCEAVGEDEAWALTELLAGHMLGAVADGLVARGGDPEAVGSFFARWQARGIVASCRHC